MDKYINDNERSIALKFAFRPRALRRPSSPTSLKGETITRGTINEETTKTITPLLKLRACEEKIINTKSNIFDINVE